MTSPRLSFDENGLQFAWDSTSLKEFLTCPRRYYYSILQGWHRPGNDHLIFGGAYAKALETYHKSRTSGADHDSALDEALSVALIEVREWQSQTPHKTRETLARSIVWYLDEFENDPCQTIILANGKPAVELSFSIELSPDILWCGHIDRMVTYSGEIFVTDNKTTGSALSAHFFSQFKPDVQMGGYTFGAKAGFAQPVRGVIIDGAQLLVHTTRFGRGFVNFDEHELEEWHDTTLTWIKLARAFTSAGHFPMNSESCDKYGGCQFRRVCKYSPTVRENFLAADFTRRGEPWDPLKRR